jgi:hypothetical protein
VRGELVDEFVREFVQSPSRGPSSWRERGREREGEGGRGRALELLPLGTTVNGSGEAALLAHAEGVL